MISTRIRLFIIFLKKDKTMHDVFIVGKGPAGISASLYTIRAGLTTVVTGKDAGALGKAKEIENYYGFAESISGPDLFNNGIEGARRLGVQILDEEVFKISYNDTFTITTDKGVHQAKAVILAAGTSRKAPPIKGLKEHEGMGVSYCAVCDAFFYRGLTTAVIGAGRYAVSEALHLLPTSGQVIILTDGRDLDADAVDMIAGLSDSSDSGHSSKLKIDTRKITEIAGQPVVDSILFTEGKALPVDGVFVAVGTASSADLARKLGVAGPDGKLILNEDMSTFIPGFYAAGDCTGGMLQISKAVYEGALAGTSVVKYIRSL